jgi:hypothetical protein
MWRNKNNMTQPTQEWVSEFHDLWDNTSKILLNEHIFIRFIKDLLDTQSKNIREEALGEAIELVEKSIPETEKSMEDVIKILSGTKNAYSIAADVMARKDVVLMLGSLKSLSTSSETEKENV